MYLRSIDATESNREGMDDMIRGYMSNKYKMEEKDKENVKKVKIQILNNMSLIYYKTRQYKKSIDSCIKIANIEPLNEKALLKLIHCNLELNNTTVAME